MFIIQPVRGRSHGRADRSSVFDQTDTNTIQILKQPVVIQCHRADDVWSSRERDHADTVVRPAFYEFARDFANRVDPRRFVAADGEIFCQHRTGNIEHEHDVDAARLHLSKALAELRSRQRHDEKGEAQPDKRPEKFAGSARATFPRARNARWQRT